MNVGVWGVKVRPGILTAKLDPDVLVFNPLSWETHVLNQEAYACLVHIQEGGFNENVHRPDRENADAPQWAPGDVAYEHFVADLQGLGLLQD